MNKEVSFYMNESVMKSIAAEDPMFGEWADNLQDSFLDQLTKSNLSRESVEEFVSFGADLYDVNRNPLHETASMLNVNNVKSLLEAGSEPNLWVGGKTVLDVVLDAPQIYHEGVVVNQEYVEICIKQLISYGCKRVVHRDIYDKYKNVYCKTPYMVEFFNKCKVY